MANQRHNFRIRILKASSKINGIEQKIAGTLPEDCKLFAILLGSLCIYVGKRANLATHIGLSFRKTSSSSLAKLGKDENVTTSVLAKICGVLNCDVSDIMEMISGENTESEDKANG